MKKNVLLLFLTLGLLSCSSDDNDNDASTGFINPPDWIIGTWQDESQPAAFQTGGFQFTDDNLITLTSNGDVLTNLKEGLQMAVDEGVITSNETITDTFYKLEIVAQGTVTNTFEFTKGTDANTIIYDLSVTFDIVLTRQ